MIYNYTGISDIRLAPLAAKLYEEKQGQALIVTSGAARAQRIASDLSFFADVPVLVLPDVENSGFLRYDAKSGADQAARLAVLTALASGRPCIVVAPALGALKKLPPLEIFSRSSFSLRVGGESERSELIEKLAAMGYERSSSAEAPGQFAVRGDILDIYSPAESGPVRLELFDTEVDSLRRYDPLTQRSIENLTRISIWPARIMTRDEKAAKRAENSLLKAYGEALERPFTSKQIETLTEKRDYVLACISEGLSPQYLENFISYFYPDGEQRCWDYASALSFVMVDDPSRIAELLDASEKEEAEIEKILLERCEAVPRDFRSYPRGADLSLINKLGADVYYCTPFAQQIRYTDRLDGLSHVQLRQAPVFSGHMDMLSQELRRYIGKGFRIVIACSSEERIVNLREFLVREGLENAVSLRFGSLSGGTEMTEEKILYLSEQDIFPKTREKRRRGSRRGGAIKAFTDLHKGDYVVHEAHGVGRFTGVEKLEVQGSVRDYLKIQYAGNDILYVPVDQMESIQKYVGSEGAAPKINGLSGGDWQRTKARAKAAIRDMAEDFLKLYAERSLAPGFAFGADSAWQKEFEDSFPYEETEDQLRASEEIKKDMESDRAMDRLLCGDVGYGKTEVAARAIFKCLEQGRQAAVLVPTTILANQHYHTFSDRLAG